MVVSSNRRSITLALAELAGATNDRQAIEERLYAKVYDELQAMARSLMRREFRNPTIHPTELVHEAYLRLVDPGDVAWECRAHFFGAAARAMRRILVDAARRNYASKRGGGWTRVTLDPRLAGREDPEFDLLALDSVLTRLVELDPRMASIVELRVFAGMTSRDVACVLGVSERTVNGDWAVAKKWLRREFAVS